MIKKTNKLPMETVLVATGDRALASGVFTTAGNSVNILDGQVGVMSYDPNSSVKAVGAYLASGDDSNEVQAIKIVQGTPASANTLNADVWEVGDKSHVESGVIRKGNIKSVSVKKWVPGTYGAAAITNFPTPTNDTDYLMFLKLDSARMDKEFSTMNDNVIIGSSAGINYTTAGIANAKDYVLSNVLAKFNSASRAVTKNGLKGRQPFVVFGVKVGGGSGQVIGTITPTTVLTFQTINGVAQTLTSSVQLVSALARLVQDNADLTATSTIENVNLATAGAAAKIDALIIVGLPERPAAIYDNVVESYVRVIPNPAKGFIAGVDPTITLCDPVEPANTGAKWSILDDLRARVQTHTMQVQPFNDWFALGKSYVNPAKNYTSYTIDYFDTESVLTNATVVSPKKVTLLFPAEVPSSFTVTVNNVITRIAAGSTPVPTVTSNDAGTGTASATQVASVEAILTAWLEHARTTGTNFTVTGDAVAGGTYLS